MKNYLILGLIVLLFGACKSTDSTAKALKAQQTRSLIENGAFELTFNWANPMVTNELVQLSNANLLPMDSRAGQINLLGTANYIKKYGDSLEVYLPYFGTRQMGGVMGSSNSAIEFEGIPTDYEFVYDEKKRRSEISFSMKEETEQYRVYIRIGSTNRATVNVNSTHRTPISYSGTVKALKEQ